MKSIYLFHILSAILLFKSGCNEKKQTSSLEYKGRLEAAGLCMNYTISVIEGKIDTSKIVAQWTDEVTKKQYSQVFKLGNPCSFPDKIKQGDEFYFQIDTAKQADCAVCMAYYPTPSKSLNIKVINK